MRSLLALSLLFAFGSSLFAAAPPNIVLILADDLGYGDLSCYGHQQFKTQRIDQMAAEGAKLTQFNCPAPFCAPTRASLMTGRYPFRCGMTSNPTPEGVIIIAPFEQYNLGAFPRCYTQVRRFADGPASSRRDVGK